MDTGTPMGSLVFTVMAALTQMELEIKRERVAESVTKCRAALYRRMANLYVREWVRTGGFIPS